MENISYTGKTKLSNQNQFLLDKISKQYYNKIQRQLKNITQVKVVVKEYTKGGKAKKFSIHIKAIAPTKVYASDLSADWDFAKALHKAFNDVEVEIKHTLHDSSHVHIHHKKYFQRKKEEKQNRAKRNKRK